MAEFAPPPTRLSGRRASLRPFRSDDAEAVAAACADPDIPRFTMMAAGLTPDDARAWIERRAPLWQNGLYTFAITAALDDTCVGQMGVHIDRQHRRGETFYWLDRSSRGSGLVSEALDMVTRWSFETHGVVRAHLITHLDNAASQRVAERCSYQREGVLRAWEPIEDEQPDVVMWSRLRTDPAPTFEWR